MARACGARHRRYESYILVQGFCGLRPGEARELGRRDFDLTSRPATVTTCGTHTDVSAKYLDEGESRERPLKGRGPKARRTIPIPEQLVPYFALHLDEFVPRRQDALVFTTATGRRINSKNFHRDTWVPAREKLFEEGNPLRRVRLAGFRSCWMSTSASCARARQPHSRASRNPSGTPSTRQERPMKRDGLVTAHTENDYTRRRTVSTTETTHRAVLPQVNRSTRPNEGVGAQLRRPLGTPTPTSAARALRRAVRAARVRPRRRRRGSPRRGGCLRRRSGCRGRPLRGRS